jgi:hypothetical protein
VSPEQAPEEHREDCPPTERLRLFLLEARAPEDMVVTRFLDIYLRQGHEDFVHEADLDEVLPDVEELMAKAEFEAEQDLLGNENEED